MRAEKGDDHWQVFADFMRHLADADTSSMTRALAGKFAPQRRCSPWPTGQAS